MLKTCGLKEQEPSDVRLDEACLREVMLFFTSDETCRTYSAPICIYIAPRRELVLLSFRLGIILSFLTARVKKLNEPSTVTYLIAIIYNIIRFSVFTSLWTRT